MLEVRNLVKTYKISKSNKNRVVALNNVSISFPETGLVFLLGKSGSGKSTLLNSIGGLDTFDSGEIIIKGKSSKDFNQSDFDSYRNTFIGFIFQEYNVLQEFTVAKNIALALELQGKKASKETVNSLLNQVDMLEFAKRKPNQLSGGQKQRIAIARALIKNPEIIMADEPTGALDSNTGKQVMETLKKLSKEKLVIIVSHDRDFAETYGDRIIELKDGQIISDLTQKEILARKSQSGISYIDNKIIHIKKDQKITREDMNMIVKEIIDNSGKSDTIISFDKKSNEEIKKVQCLTEDGNKKEFLPTLPEDIHIKKYDTKLKLIKSKLKFKDSFKMGASALKSKVGKLIVTILLSIVAFTLFGIASTASDFNRAGSVYESIKTNNTQIVSLQKREAISNDFDDVLTNVKAKEIDELQTKFNGVKISGIVSPNLVTGESMARDVDLLRILIGSQYIDVTDTNNNPFKSSRVSGMMNVDEINNFDFKLVAGSLPTSSEEICITKSLYDVFNLYAKTTSDLSTMEKFLKTADKAYIYNKIYSIVGIIDTKTDNSKYYDISRDKAYEVENLLNYGYSNLIFGNLTACDTLRDTLRVSYCVVPENIDFGYCSIQISKSYIDPSLKDNEAIVNSSYFEDKNGNKIPESELQAQIEAGTLTITLSMVYTGGKDSVTFKVVGLDGNRFSASFVNGLLDGSSSYIIAKLSDNDKTNKEFIKYCENGANSVSFIVQNDTTSTLDNFGSFIKYGAKIMLYIGIGFAAFASLLLMNFISTSISYKKREIGILRALGARGSDVFKVFFYESLIIAVINAVFATVATIVSSILINTLFSQKLGKTLTLMIFGVKQAGLILLISVACAFIASLLPVIRISKKRPIDAINNR